MLLPGENVLSAQQGKKDSGSGRVDAMNFKNPYLWMFKKTTKIRRRVWGQGQFRGGLVLQLPTIVPFLRIKVASAMRKSRDELKLLRGNQPNPRK